MLIKKMIGSAIVLFFILSICICCFADDTPVTVVNETRVVSIAGNSIQYAGTPVSISVWYPKKSYLDVTAAADLSAINAYSGYTEVELGGAFSKTFKLKENAPSGRYTVNIYIPGDSEPRQYFFDYRDVIRAQDILNITKTGTAGDILTAFENGINHIDVEAGDSYYTYNATEKNYVCTYISTNKPTDFTDLQTKLRGSVEQINLTREITSTDRSDVRNIIQTDYVKFYITDEAMQRFRSLSAMKQEKTMVLLNKYIQGCLLPEEIAQAFSKAIEESSEPTTEPKNSSPLGGGSGRTKVNSIALPAEITQTSFPPIEAPETFQDLASCPWAKTAIITLAERKILNGKSETEFYPNDYIKKEEFVKLIIGSLNIKGGSANALPFADVPFDAWYYESVSIALNANITKGISEKEFGTGTKLSRQDLATLLYNAIKSKNKILNPVIEEITFSDAEQISDYAKSAVDALAKAGILSGRDNGAFDPRGLATRAEAAKILYQVLVYFDVL